MPDTSPRVTNPRGRPRKDAEFAPTEKVMVAAIEAFFRCTGTTEFRCETLNEQLGC